MATLLCHISATLKLKKKIAASITEPKVTDVVVIILRGGNRGSPKKAADV